MKKFFLTLCISLCLISAAHAIDKNSQNCAACDQEHSEGAHKKLACSDCHEKSGEHYGKAADFESGAKTCLNCHEEYEGMLHSGMVTRDSEQKFVHKAFNGVDNDFYSKNCSNCHVTSCTDCHSDADKPHQIVRPDTDTCQECHRDYYIGIEYSGHGQRDDNERYDRGLEHVGGHYASMLPDVHYDAGLKCSDCHSMKSLAKGEKSSKGCTDCHKPDNKVIEHSVTAHMEKMECYTCHSAWANQEYGTFWIKLQDTKYEEYFKWVKRPHIDYAKSSHTKEYSAFPIALNKDGKYSPVRPEYVMFLTNIKNDKVIGAENRMVSNYYKAVFPHTVRRETVNCESCHASGRRFMHEKPTEQIFDLRKDGLLIDSFYKADYFRMDNGRFVTNEEHLRIQEESDKYKRLLVRKWQGIVNLLK